MKEIILDVRKAVKEEISKSVSDLFSEKLTPASIELIIKCPHIINMLSEKLDKTIDNFIETDDDVELTHVCYTSEQLGYDK